MKRLRPKTALAKGLNSRKGGKGRRARSSKNLKMTDKDLRRPSEIYEYSQPMDNFDSDGEGFDPQP
jgi:hypothetical protein